MHAGRGTATNLCIHDMKMFGRSTNASILTRSGPSSSTLRSRRPCVRHGSGNNVWGSVSKEHGVSESVVRELTGDAPSLPAPVERAGGRGAGRSHDGTVSTGQSGRGHGLD